VNNLKKLLAKKASELLNKTASSTDEVTNEPAKWMLGSIEVPQDKKESK
jgi:hypothetical protein